MKRRKVAAFFCGMLAFSAAGKLRAQESVGDFYHNHTLHMLVGYGSGSGYDAYMRMLAKYFSRHLAGNPTIVVDNMPGAGGLTMMNNLSNSAVRDGSVIAMGVRPLFLEPLFGDKLALYDPRKLTWIGSMTRDVSLCFTSRQGGPGSFSGAMKTQVLLGSTGFSTDSYFVPQLLNAMLGTKFKVVLGYPDNGSVGIAMEHGEVQGICAVTYGAITSTHPDWITEKKIDILIQLTFGRAPQLPDVPSLSDFVKNDATHQALDVVFGTTDMARAVIAPPGIPDERVAALRRAFGETLQDPAFLEDAKRAGLEIAPVDAAKLMDEIVALYKTPAAVVQNVIAIRDKQQAPAP